MITSKKDLNVYRAASGMWYYVFQIPARYHPEGKVGVQVRRSSGKRDEAAARDVAWADFMQVCGLMAAAEAEPRKAFKSPFPTVAEVITRYRERIHTFNEIQTQTVANNISALLWHLKLVGLDAVKVRVDQLSASLVLQARKAYYAREDEDWAEQDPSINYTLNSQWNQARSVLGEKAEACYKGWRSMPAEIGFLEAPRLNQKDPCFVGISHIREIDAAARAELRVANPVAWVCYELARWGGLRAGEIAALQWPWMMPRGEEWIIEIRPRAGREMADGTPWSPKRHKARAVPIRAERVQEWVKALGSAPVDFLVPGKNAALRKVWLIEHVNSWISPWLPDREKRLHELRKQIGSEVYTTQGPAAAAEFLGDTLETTMRHYAKFLGSVKAM